MYYLKMLFFNFLIVFFANHILPGIDVANQTKLPHIGGDLIFAFVLGLLNSLIFLGLKILDKVSVLRIGILSLVISFVSYAILKILPLGIHITNVKGYFLASILVAAGSFLTNFLEMKRTKSHHSSNPVNP
ncbi:MAG: phage holin family protein [Chlamydiia bacterium]|nr:phage holin family protein [Chlamydiia bacterium]